MNALIPNGSCVLVYLTKEEDEVDGAEIECSFEVATDDLGTTADGLYIDRRLKIYIDSDEWYKDQPDNVTDIVGVKVKDHRGRNLGDFNVRHYEEQLLGCVFVEAERYKG
jgi:hypothetical protein